jgi:hypothetical protein
VFILQEKAEYYNQNEDEESLSQVVGLTSGNEWVVSYHFTANCDFEI